MYHFWQKRKTYTLADIAKALEKCDKEELSGSDEEQPLFLDEANECIMCNWCPNWKGAIEVKVANQHVRKAKSHQEKRRKDDTGQSLGTRDIRNYFVPIIISESSDDEYN